MFRIEIETSNAAFVEQPGAELGAILEALATRVREDLGSENEAHGQLRDTNGNTVGMWDYTPE